MAQKRILILDTGREWGGGTNSLLELLKRIDRTRYTFSALFYHNYRFENDSDIKKELERLDVEFIHLKRTPQGGAVKVIKETGRILLFFSRTLRRRFIFYIDLISRILPDSRRISLLMKEKGVDLIYMNNQPSSNLEGILASGTTGIPSVQHARIDVDLNPFEVRCVNRYVDRIICVSRGVMASLTGAGVERDRCAVVYNGIDPDVLPQEGKGDVIKELGIEGKDLVTGTVCSLIRRKRVHLLLEAVAEIKGMGMAVGCIIVGDGPERKKLEEQSRRLGIEKEVVFTGFRRDTLRLINAMDVFVLSSEREGFPRVVLEAMALKKPVVAFRITGPDELVVDGRTGILLEDHRGSSITGALLRFIKDRESIIRMGEAGRQRVKEEFDIKRYVTGVERVFGEVLGE